MCFMFFIEEKNGTITFMSDHMEKTNFGLKSQGWCINSPYGIILVESTEPNHMSNAKSYAKSYAA